MSGKKWLLSLSGLLLCATAMAGDINQDARDIAADAAQLSRETADIQSDRLALQKDLAGVAGLRVQRRAEEQALSQAVQAGDLTAAQSELARITALTGSIRQAEAAAIALHQELKLDRLQRALERAELNQDVRDLSGDLKMKAEATSISNSQIAADQAALNAAVAAMEATQQQKVAALQAMKAAVVAGDISAAQAALAKVQALHATLKSQAQSVATAHAQLSKDRAAAKAAAKGSAKAAGGSKGKK
ncbi:hypothetical protein [Aquitalea magnusonii]|uniref:Uncharacterized protein n=1 Tax=Aquitalea magnusonii TaxID=332411 RepID=A0A318JHI8_9NEIS|nr:hypothetical protein [Aquitalea magnusonii]PXX49131.1 hypothetical protein DFR38_105174 [Aquitalea magnusonii]